MTDDRNPYSPPRADTKLEPEFDESQLIPAAIGWRFANYLIDFCMLMFLIFVAMVIVALIGGDEALEKFENVPDIILSVAAMLLYYVTTESLWGRTLGKLITGTRVVDEKGRHPGFGQIFGRTLCRIIPFEAFSFLFGDGRGWHDSIPKTLVIKVPR